MLNGGNDMPEEILELTVDKFTFRVPKGLYYTDAGVWVRLEGDTARLGLSDFAQQRSGDMAFAEVKPVGTAIEPGDEFAAIETIKVDIALPSPVSGAIVEINPALEESPEQVNTEPYGNGWMIKVRLRDRQDLKLLLSPQDYAAVLRGL